MTRIRSAATRIPSLSLLPFLLAVTTGATAPATETPEPATTPAAQAVEDNPELFATLKMVGAHRSLRTARVADADSDDNKFVLQTMLQKAIQQGPTPWSAPAVTTPKAAIVGKLDGQFSVNNHGVANYDLTFRIPDARGGMKPDLSLYYSSGSGNGVAGKSFSLSTGFSNSITRGRSILARDEEVRGTELSPNDRFYLDGKRLLCISGPDTNGKPGSLYRTEVDSNATITAAGTGDVIESFILKDAYGRTCTFGKYIDATDGYQCGFDEARAALDPLAFTYALKRIEDPVGNHIDFDYEHKGFGVWVLSKIHYTGGRDIPAPYTIAFTYSPPPKPARSYRALRRDDPCQRLDSIEIFANPEANVVARYLLSYDEHPAHGGNRLLAVNGYLASAIGGELQALPPDRFRWETVAPCVGPLQPFPLPTACAADPAMDVFGFGDFNGDGTVDYLNAKADPTVYLTARNGFERVGANWLAQPANHNAQLPPERRRLLIANLDGDSRSDVLFLGDDATLSAVVSRGDHFEAYGNVDFKSALADPKTDGSAVASYTLLGGEGLAATARLSLADLNGDGRDDLVVHGYDGKLHVWISNGSGFTEALAPAEPNGEVASVGTEKVVSASPSEFDRESHASQSVRPFISDLNNDGQSDYAWLETVRKPLPGANSYRLSRRFCFVLAMPHGGFSKTTTLWEKTRDFSDTHADAAHAEPDTIVLPGDYNGDGMGDFMLCDTAGDEKGNPACTLLLSRSPSTERDAAQPDGFVRLEEALPTFTLGNGGVTLSPFSKYTSRGRQLAPRDDPTFGQPVFALDVDRDGCDDVVWYAYPAGAKLPDQATGWWVIQAQGDGTFLPPRALTGSPWVDFATVQRNGAASANDTKGRRSGAEARLAAIEDPSPEATFQISRSFDFDGDGEADWLLEAREPAGSARTIGTVRGAGDADFHSATGDFITDFIDGFGSTVHVAYKAAKDQTVYTRGPSLAYPIREILSNSRIVSDIWRDTGDALGSQYSYLYSSNRLDYSGRGGLGFADFITVDRQTNFCKYQHLVTSFPMTGLVAREQTYRFWEADKKIALQILSAKDHTVLFDAVANPFTKRLYGTVVSYTAEDVAYRWYNSSEAHYVYEKDEVGERRHLFGRGFPSTPPLRTTTTHWFDNQNPKAAPHKRTPNIGILYREQLWSRRDPSTPEAATALAQAVSHIPGKILFANEVATRIQANSDPVETTRRTFVKPIDASDSMVKRVETEVKERIKDGEQSSVEAKSSYTYFNRTTLRETETTENKDQGERAISYKRDPLGRLLRKTQTSTGGTGATKEQEEVLYEGRDYIDRIDQAVSEYTKENGLQFYTYNTLLRDVTSINYDNKSTSLLEFDPLGRVTSVINDVNAYKKTTTYAWTVPEAEGWRALQRVAPPAGAEGITSVSIYAVRVEKTGDNTVTTYYDRMSRAIRTVTEDGKGELTCEDKVYNLLGYTTAVSGAYKPGSKAHWTLTTYDDFGNEASTSESDAPTEKLGRRR